MLGSTRVRVAGLAVVVAAAVAALVGAGSGRGAARSPDVRVFAAVSSSTKLGLNVELRSAKTGAVASVLWHLGESWTNNGFAFSPDERYVYFTLIPRSTRFNSLLLEQLSVATHRARFIAFGEQPSVSPDGRLLAYASGEDRTATVVVRDTASGRRRSINVARLLGTKVDMLNASLAWLGDGQRLAVFESCCAVAVSSTSAQEDQLHLVVVSVPPGGELSARQVALPRGFTMPNTVASETTRPNSLLVSSLIAGDRAAVDRVTIGSARATLSRVLAIPHSLVVGFDPGGQKVLYLVGHSGPDLWAATLHNHRLSQAHLLIKNPPFDAYAW
jgi:WD40-like Beta Propeller Repeat